MITDEQRQSMLKEAGVTDGTRMFEVWVEGFNIMGEKGEAQRIGIFSGKTFREACLAAWGAGKFNGYGEFDEKRLTVWGCRLFETEAEARRSFG